MPQNTATVEVTTTDRAWIAAHTTGRVEERVTVPGCTITDRYTFCGREWVHYRLPVGVPLPKGWDRGVENVLAAPATWVHETVPAGVLPDDFEYDGTPADMVRDGVAWSPCGLLVGGGPVAMDEHHHECPTCLDYLTGE